jgi:hypothetical protein
MAMLTSVGSYPVLAPSLASALAALTATVIQNVEGNKSSTDSFRWYGDKDGAEYKPNVAVSGYLPLQTLDLFPSYCHASVATNHSLPWTC